jgi:3-dehydroquinate synthase
MQSSLNEQGLTVRVDLGSRSYEIRVVTGRRGAFGAFTRTALDRDWGGRSCRTALLVTDSNVADMPLPEDVLTALESIGIVASLAVVPAGEQSKSLGQVESLYDELLRVRADRHTLIVALGGGVIGDLAGFVAATYSRGLPLLMVPTTLLAQVDSAVGGKVGVNHPRAKNIIGAFHQPIGVWIDTDHLATLPPRELRCGIAEVVKYGVILDANFFAELERDVDRIVARENRALRSIIARSCELKADVVSRDEREETGLRAVLNFGHTIGHAIEAVAGYGGAYQHGEAVAVGMVAEARLARRLGWVDVDVVERIIALLARFGLPTTAPGLDPDRLIEAMGRDKKNQGGRLRFVLPRRIGFVELTDAATEADVRAALAEI